MNTNKPYAMRRDLLEDFPNSRRAGCNPRYVSFRNAGRGSPYGLR